MGKYASVTNHLPRLQANEQTYQDRIEQRKELFRHDTEFSETAVALAALYTDLRSQEDIIEEQAKDVRLSLEAVSQMLSEQYEIEGTTSVKLASGQSVTVRLEPYATVKDKDALREWALANGLERLMTLPWSTVNAITKERLLKGDPEPNGVETFAKSVITLRKA